MRLVIAGMVLLVAACGGCGSRAPVSASADNRAKPADSPPVPTGPLEIRATGTIQAIRAITVQVPRIEGQVVQTGPNAGRLTLVKLVPNGWKANKGDVIAEFDRTPQVDAAREAQAKFEDLTHQVRQKAAENRTEAEKRSLELKQADADFAKAQLELQKGPILADVDRRKAQISADKARAALESLKKIDASRRRAEAAALRILELQTERQKLALERATRDSEKLVLRAPFAGMVALENIWRGGSMGNAQEGDQLSPGQSLLKIFDPSEMAIRAMISEPDRAALTSGAPALARLDAYPDAVFRAHFVSANPVATAAMGSPIKNFAAQFRLEDSDPRLLPDLSVAVVIHAERPSAAPAASAQLRKPDSGKERQP